jgi:hypothetical protein
MDKISENWKEAVGGGEVPYSALSIHDIIVPSSLHKPT